ncbi:hypothetical protein HUO13_12025 [Saccharopolyspora erythraea]|uniref:hypothetical protein n=1 Tax=Saccharopolyspora erythraea TaxID=1836 RepID=UPI001BA4BB97|nr:hypothetical protein [Saccharopolyspora erythraea]QUH01440.1 hypothetical protein HUO13_12025 [Saccharopolyspora erythraea]
MTKLLVPFVQKTVPALWAALVTWLVSAGAPGWLVDALAGAEAVVLAVAFAAVYALIEAVEPKLPSWLRAALVAKK